MIEDKDTKIVIPFFEGLIYPVNAIKSNLKNFCFLTSVFALITTIIINLLGRSVFCGLEQENSYYCSISPFNTLTSFFILLIGFALYTNRWDLITKNNINTKDTLKQLYYPKDLKAFIIIITNLIFWATIVLSIYLLNTKKPTPDFYFELGYFILFSLLILISIVFLLNNVIFTQFLDGKKWFVLNKTFWPIFDNIYKLFLWFLIYFIFFAQIFRAIFLNIMNLKTTNYVYTFSCEFIFFFFLYTTFAFWITSLRYQEKYLFSNEN